MTPEVAVMEEVTISTVLKKAHEHDAHIKKAVDHQEKESRRTARTTSDTTSEEEEKAAKGKAVRPKADKMSRREKHLHTLHRINSGSYDMWEQRQSES